MGSRRICPERGHEIPRERRCGYVEQDRLASALTSCWGELRAIVGLCVAEPDGIQFGIGLGNSSWQRLVGKTFSAGKSCDMVSFGRDERIS